jgi:hypothetical protein
MSRKKITLMVPPTIKFKILLLHAVYLCGSNFELRLLKALKRVHVKNIGSRLKPLKLP